MCYVQSSSLVVLFIIMLATCWDNIKSVDGPKQICSTLKVVSLLTTGYSMINSLVVMVWLDKRNSVYHLQKYTCTFCQIITESNKNSSVMKIFSGLRSSSLYGRSLSSVSSSSLLLSVIAHCYCCATTGKFIHLTHSQPGPQWLDRFLQPQLLFVHPFLQLQPFVRNFHYIICFPINSIVTTILQEVGEKSIHLHSVTVATFGIPSMLSSNVAIKKCM